MERRKRAIGWLSRSKDPEGAQVSRRAVEVKSLDTILRPDLCELCVKSRSNAESAEIREGRRVMISKSISATAIALVLCAVVLGQTKNFTPVDGANLKAKIDSAIIAGKANAPQGRFWVGYQFEVTARSRGRF